MPAVQDGFTEPGRDDAVGEQACQREVALHLDLPSLRQGGQFARVALPGDALRLFIDSAAEVQRAMGFQNEKDHPEVAPSQFEINYSYGDVVTAADQIQIYKLICRQVATKMGLTATFLPKPVVGVNGNGMHTNVSINGKDGKNLGADVDLVGPGPAYERWKKTPEYQQWLKDTGQLRAEAPKAEPKAFVVLTGKGAR